MRFLCLLSLLLCSFFVAGAFAGTNDPQERELRKNFLDYLENEENPTLDGLKAFYKRPSNIPYRLRSYEPEPLIKLGKKLFFDPRLSSSQHMSCATCHNPSFHWTDTLKESVEGNGRRTMALYNLAWDNRFLWAGGPPGSLMSQAILALTAPLGMSSDLFKAAEKIKGLPEYESLFFEALGRENAIHPDTMALALEFYVSSIISGTAPFDEWVDGNEDALNEQEKEGFFLFNTKANCASCHNTWRFSDAEVYDVGLKKSEGPFHFKAVGLRNIAERPPYMHDGRFNTLIEVLQFYNRGGDVTREGKSDLIAPLHLETGELAALLAFLGTLSDDGPEVKLPILPN